ncbi:MAG: hypothetical protein PHG65_11150 [Kiritimatiellae bacterium]|nr:hypothetical protein [Kiritimatiellia bacterium]
MRKYLMGWVVLLLLGTTNGFAREGFVEVTHQDLLDYPQKYWSQSIIFQDELLSAPQGDTITIASKRYDTFQTANLGNCYAEEDLVPELQRGEPGAQYLFQGTVLHQPSSFFSRSPSFYVVVQRMSRVVNAAGQVQDVFSSEQKTLSPDSEALMRRIQQDLINYARKNKVSMGELFAPDFPQREMVYNIIYSGVSAVEQQYNTNARKMLGDFVAEVFELEFGKADRIYVSQTMPAPEAGAQPESLLPGLDQTFAPSPEPKPTTAPDTEDHTEALRRRAAAMLKPGLRPLPTPAPESNLP